MSTGEKTAEKRKAERAYRGEGSRPRELTDGHIRLISDICAIVIGFLLAGRHFIFSSYPLGVAFVAALPHGVWPALLGAALGSLTLGKSGIIYSMICVLVVFLRVVISGVEKPGGEKSHGRMFSESIPLRICAAVIGCFVVGVYEILLTGFGVASVMFALSMIALCALAVPVIACVFGSGVGMRDFLTGKRNVFFVNKGDKKARIRLVLFKISLAVFVFFVSFSLAPYRFFGIDAGLIFSALVTLFAARRFGWLYGLSAGFVSSFGITGLYSVSFALMGAVSGALFAFGVPYSLVGGGVVLALWGMYAGGVSGALSVIPEYIIAASLSFPLYSYLERERTTGTGESTLRMATDMVGTMALAHRNKRDSSLSLLEKRITESCSAVRSFKEYLDPFAEGYLEGLSASAGLMRDVGAYSERERNMDEELTERLEGVFSESGFPDGVIRAFGERGKHVICAGEDKDGLLITSAELRAGLEDAAGRKFLAGEYFRRGDMVLMECEAAPGFRLEGASASSAGDGGEVSGDSVELFVTDDMYSCAIIADGMGRGEIAKRTSELVSAYIRSVLGCGVGIQTALSVINMLIKHGVDECSVGFDMFLFDLMRSDARFIKSGAAPSFIKRGDSLFRISSRTVPIGVLGGVDAEQIRAQIKLGDTVIMMSDGVCDGPDAAPWLIELLGGELRGEPSDIASRILAAAKEHAQSGDDMSVVVLRVCEAEPGK